jgi:hypothetical protein
MSFGAAVGSGDTAREATGREVNRAIGTGPPDRHQREINTEGGLFGTVANILGTAASGVGTIIGGPVGLGLRAAGAIPGIGKVVKTAKSWWDSQEPDKPTVKKKKPVASDPRASRDVLSPASSGKRTLGVSPKL